MTDFEQGTIVALLISAACVAVIGLMDVPWFVAPAALMAGAAGVYPWRRARK